MIIELFPQALYQSMVNVSDDEYNLIINSSDDVYRNEYGNFTSTDTFFLSRLPNLKDQIDHHLKEYCETIIGSSIDLLVTQSWVNYNPKGTSHHTHWHPNSVVSGVVYITKQPSNFVAVKQQKHGLLPSTNTTTKYNLNRMFIDVSQNTILLFPSDLVHGVDINTNDTARISLSFNTFYKGSLGIPKQLDYLEIK